MLIVAIAWVYIVGMIAVTETSIVAGILDFVLYCIVPMSLFVYLQRSKMRSARQEHLRRLQARQALDPELHQALELGAESSPTAKQAATPANADEELEKATTNDAAANKSTH